MVAKKEKKKRVAVGKFRVVLNGFFLKFSCLFLFRYSP